MPRMTPIALARRISRLVTTVAGDNRGSFVTLFAISLVPIVLAVGVVIDYGQANQRKTHLNAIADAAALSAVTNNAMSLSAAAAQQLAVTFFNSQAALLLGITYNDNVNITVNDTQTTNARIRNVTVSYSIQSINTFAGILGLSSIPIGNSATASATSAANINFYLMIDTSPSMAIAATEQGIATMVANTASQGGCAFACHETDPAADNLGDPNGEDNYALARNLGVTLRMDLVSQAVSSMVSTAQNTAQNTGAAYSIAGYSFDVAVNNVIPKTSNMSTAATEASDITPLVVYNNNCLTKSDCNSDQDTNFDLAFETINAAMPKPGNGTNAPGDTPQEVLFIVTDGVSDESSSGARIYTPFGADQTWCSQIKTRGIRIAVLYTTYNPLPTNSWYNTYIAPEQASIATTAQACASPGLYYKVDAGGDISAALNALFQTAVASAHLTE